ncbi:tellurite resistance TerB C-terminal domain-containing protein [Lyngbya aestuarii]|uniref:tellurite resistance TerB C-terminal domain-containing protein n=1 Tax=Lyngbya aestuarii TaxID=118322 RepID=UPI00403DE243
MQSPKLANQVTIGVITFAVSFILGFIVNRDGKQALLTGLIAVPASYTGVIVASKRRTNQERLVKYSLINQIEELEEEEEQLYDTLSLVKTTTEQLEASISNLYTERLQLLSRVSELHSQRDLLNHDLILLQNQKQQTIKASQELQAEIQAFERHQRELSQTLSVRVAELERAENHKHSLQTELNQLQAQITEQEKNKDTLQQELIKFEAIIKQHKFALINFNDSTKTAPTNSRLPTELPLEWTNLMVQLPEHEVKILKAVAEQDNPLATIKSIAEEKITMPELLIDSINERALDTVGDLLIEPGSNPPVIADHEYLVALQQMIRVYEDSINKDKI